MAATHTPNLNLNKPDRQDFVSVVHDINDNMDKIDEEAGMVDDGIAIVIDGNTAPRAISSGQYLLIKNHSTLATGGYHATANIASGASVTNSNVSPDSDGIANALNSNMLPKSSVYNGLNAVNTGYALDAVQGKALNDSIAGIANYEKITNLSLETSVNLFTVAVNSVIDATIKTFYDEDATNINDYPVAMTSVGATVRVYYTVRRCSQRLLVTIKAAKGDGSVCSIDGFGYDNGASFTWGNVY